MDTDFKGYKELWSNKYHLSLIILNVYSGDETTLYMWEGIPLTDNETVLFNDDDNPYIKMLSVMSPEALKLLETYEIDEHDTYLFYCDSTKGTMKLLVYEDV